ncbi:hypothetical protein N0B31_03255 [Salinirubellus salinus]|uniref:DUF7344 domain-containing protein n=1 Tax=Salinirubellus salinus TaxID=1364945 RepID=A0A9E7UC27_9EURY|nr:hypothetical protein [Salinirubellus salinus]UWM55309.1 hypothetical protein N0B31_03255 [Salinirubellus salinus]
MGTSQSDPSRTFELLSNHRRRYTWHHCKRVEDAVPLGDLAEQVAAWENGKSVAEITSAERKRVYTSLQQTHLPKLDDADVVQFEDGVVELGERADELEVYVDVVDGDDIPWSEYYLGLTAVSSALLAGVWLTGATEGLVSGLGWAAIVVLAFAFSALAHLLTDRERRLGTDALPPELEE